MAANDIAARIKSWLGSTAPTVGQKTMASSLPVVVASDQTPVPVSLAGIGQYVDDEEMFSVAESINAASSGSDNPLLLIRNPASSGVAMYLYSVQAGILVENNYCLYKVFLGPTISATGTGLTPVQRKSGGTATSSLNVYSIPTISASGTRIDALIQGQNQNALAFSSNFSLRLDEGDDLLITAKPKSNNRESAITAIWREVAI